ncbi:formimidoylglutamate deiminase [Pseudodonghicola flavimaris]|uniref:Formimidoylglutamate deiminase n=1 Tax=Pseudodonghicola flavimaris TaxID=3050036 RepID=A0ABT7EW65_9RHOB|nr:formimidoylglutamate deiminase [Pseudodonghicola flavimaris]MDK3016581.1 formimidoylglutamate deiminase [Pseudodonghicola flavimaris]
MTSPRLEGAHFRLALTPDGWKRNLSARFDDAGLISALAEDDNPLGLPVYDRPVVPGVTDLHSHAFQYAMAGLSEVRRNPVDSFWSWRDIMYFFALTLSPEDMQAIAARLYLSLLKGGYTGIVEFHYVHNDLDGTPYARREELSLAIFEAAQATGIDLTHLPVFYAHSNFGGLPPTEGQRRFIQDLDGYAAMIQALKAPAAAAGHTLGIAPHSLRAVTAGELGQLMELRADLLPDCPVHIHVAEQVKEVEDALAWNGRRPVEQLFDMAPVDHRWCLIHATHLNDAEVSRIARSGATVGLCPMTEANLGDGIFRATDFLAEGGVFGIGSDSNIATVAAQELQQLEYSQRLRDRQRNVLAAPGQPHVAANLWTRAAQGGARAAGRPEQGIAIGGMASFVELSSDEPAAMAPVAAEAALDFHVFAGRGFHVGDVVVRGRKAISAGHHPQEDRILADYAAAMARVSARLATRDADGRMGG